MGKEEYTPIPLLNMKINLSVCKIKYVFIDLYIFYHINEYKNIYKLDYTQLSFDCVITSSILLIKTTFDKKLVR